MLDGLPIGEGFFPMAFMIPEVLADHAPDDHQRLFDVLRRTLPPECTVWYASALEVEAEQAVPFLVMGEETGIAAITSVDWLPKEFESDVTGYWLDSEARLSTSRLQSLQTHRSRARGLHRLWIESALPELVDGESLRPAFHEILVFSSLSVKDINALRLRHVAPDAVVLAFDEFPQLYHILRQHTPYDRWLTGPSFNAARLVVSPSLQIRMRSRNVSADGELSADTAPSWGSQYVLLDLQQEQAVKSYAQIPPDHQVAARDLDTRLLRGVVGSGKSLILLHRAKFLSQLYPQWRILLLTYNRSLADYLANRLDDLPGSTGQIEIINFHAWCRRFLYEADLWPSDVLSSGRKRVLQGVVGSHRSIVESLGEDYLLDEFDWIRDQGHLSWDRYAKAERRGRAVALRETQREKVFELFRLYRQSMWQQSVADWAEVPLIMLRAIAKEKVSSGVYDAILIDEGQDFAPSWFAIAQKMLRPETNMLFLVADAAQKIYRRSLSWKTLGIDVTGNRSRILKRSYRNTYEILRVAYEVISSDPYVQQDLRSEGEDLVPPELDATRMRRGPVPFILSFASSYQESQHIAREIKRLRENGLDWNDIAIMYRDSKTLKAMQSCLKGEGIPCQIVRGTEIDLASDDVKLLTLHSSKGLEFLAVFVAGVERLNTRPGLSKEELDAQLAEERRLLYVGMTRARELLFISHAGPLPLWVSAALTILDRR